MRLPAHPWSLFGCLLASLARPAAGQTKLSVGTGKLPATPPGRYCPLTPGDHRNAASFAEARPCVGTTYFYWYDAASKAHVIDGDGTDALTTHPVDVNALSYKDPAWHRGQLTDMIDAGIDFLMPVYWGFPQADAYESHWSFVGLPPLVAAHDAVEKSGKKPPAIGLFYDTSSLHHNRYRGRPTQMDLTTPLGRDWFYSSIRDFFSMIPPKKWARVDGKPIVFLYSAHFAKRHDAALFPYVRKRFQQDFGCGVYLVRHTDWQSKADAWYSWGGAIQMRLAAKVAAFGPGYDHSAVPRRSRLVVDRRGGALYRENWNRLLAMHPARRPFLVHLETWNEWHEGSDIAASTEFGRQYIELTRHFADRFRRGERVAPAGPYADAEKVTFAPGNAAGLDLRPSRADGKWTLETRDGRRVVVTTPERDGQTTYLYFHIDDSFLFDADAVTVAVTVTYFDAGWERFTIEYDSTRSDAGPLGGAFRPGPTTTAGRTETLKTVTLTLPECRFVNRGNGADFRLAVQGGNGKLSVAAVTVTRKQP